jgi:glycosyltransferase involved in cell wall biosynthesis
VFPRSLTPAARGAALRVFHLLRGLGRRNSVIRVGQATTADRRKKRTAAALWRYVELRNPLGCQLCTVTDRGWISAPLLSGLALEVVRPRVVTSLLAWADVCLVEFPWQFGYCRRIRGTRPTVLSSLNVEADKFDSYAIAAGIGRRRRLWLRYVEALEKAAMLGADLIVSVSEADRARMIELYGVDDKKIVVVPNGADTEAVVPATEGERTLAKICLGLGERPVVLFVGGSRVPPNVAGLDWIRRVAATLPDFTFLVVGGVVPRPARSGNIVATGQVADIRPFLRAADMALCPIEFGAGTKLKLFEALAAGLPTVAFEETVRGTSLVADMHLLIARKEVTDVGSMLLHLREQVGLRRRLSNAGRGFVRIHHDWQRSAGILEEALITLVGRQDGRCRMCG